MLSVRQKDGEARFAYSFKKPIIFQPALVDGNVYVGTGDGLLICLKTNGRDADGDTKGLEIRTTISESAACELRRIPAVRDYRTLFRTAEFANRLASTLFSRGMCDMEKASERDNFWQVQCRE